MKSFDFSNVRKIEGDIELPGDKSISHRLLFLAAMANSRCVISNLPDSQDIRNTLNVLKQMKVHLYTADDTAVITKKEKIPENIRFKTGESGTLFSLLSGYLSGKVKNSEIEVKGTLINRDYKLLEDALNLMGTDLERKTGGIYSFKSGHIKGIKYELPVPSAQLKSALIFAGGNAENNTLIKGKIQSRNHTETMLNYLTDGKNIEITDEFIRIKPDFKFEGFNVKVPGDISSASYFIIPALFIQGSNLKIRNVSLNSSRIKHLEFLKMQGADIKISQGHTVLGEPAGTVTVKYSPNFKPFSIGEQYEGYLIDEYPLLFMTASLLEDVSTFVVSERLNNKESSRIKSMYENLKGAAQFIIKDNYVKIGILKNKKVLGIKSFSDHRIAMTMVIYALINRAKAMADDFTCINKSFPEFEKILKRIAK